MSKKKHNYMDSTYMWGNIFMVTAICVLVAVPVAICVKFDAWPTFKQVFDGLLKVIPIFWTSAVLEIVVYAPMLGTGATYLSFVTGNISNLKLPVAIDAMEKANVKANIKRLIKLSI